MRTLAFSICFLAPALDCCAVTVGGILTSDTHWTLSNSPYIATSSVLIDSGAKLTIDPGVEVRFAKTTGLVVVNGTLAARGTVNSPIKFTADQAGSLNGWNGIRFGDLTTNAVFNGDLYTAGSILEAAIIEGVAEHFNGAVRVESSSPFIHDSQIRNNRSSGIRAVNASGLRIVGNRIENNDAGATSGGAVDIQNSFGVRIIGNEFYDNKSYQGGGVKVDGSNNAIVTDNSFERNFGRDYGAGFYNTNSSGTKFIRNLLSDNETEDSSRPGGAADFERSNNVLFEQNTVQGTKAVTALRFEDLTGLTMRGDRIVDNLGHGLYFHTNVSNAVVSSASSPTTIAGNGGYEIYNNQLFELSTNPLAKGNVDARNVWWKISDISAVQADVFDFLDNSFKGIVFLDPIKVFADFDGDSDVDGDDLNHPTLGWAARFGTTLDGADFLRWQRDLGFGVPSASPLAAVPEPRCTSLLFVAGIWVFSRIATDEGDAAGA